jgi:hypothetical protein
LLLRRPRGARLGRALRKRLGSETKDFKDSNARPGRQDPRPWRATAGETLRSQGACSIAMTCSSCWIGP